MKNREPYLMKSLSSVLQVPGHKTCCLKIAGPHVNQVVLSNRANLLTVVRMMDTYPESEDSELGEKLL